MNAEHNEQEIFSSSDEEFNTIYPLKIQKLSSRHWTPIKVAKRAAAFLAEQKDARILDIGSGVGKFCMVAAITSEGHFTGVEQREALVRLSNKISRRFQIPRVEFILADIRSIDFKDYNAFYFFNSFEENRDLTDSIDEDTRYDPSLYETNNQYLYKQFDSLPMGTRIVTYCTLPDIIPEAYVKIRSEIKGKLNFWIKRH